MQEYCLEINKLENKMTEFSETHSDICSMKYRDPILVIKWKEIYELLENASDKCEDVADVLDTIAIKNA